MKEGINREKLSARRRLVCGRDTSTEPRNQTLRNKDHTCMCLHAHTHTHTHSHAHTNIKYPLEKFPDSLEANLQLFSLYLYEVDIAKGRRAYVMWGDFDMVLNFSTTNTPDLCWTTGLIFNRGEWEKTVGHLALELFFSSMSLYLPKTFSSLLPSP